VPAPPLPDAAPPVAVPSIPASADPAPPVPAAPPDAAPPGPGCADAAPPEPLPPLPPTRHRPRRARRRIRWRLPRLAARRPTRSRRPNPKPPPDPVPEPLSHPSVAGREYSGESQPGLLRTPLLPPVLRLHGQARSPPPEHFVLQRGAGKGSHRDVLGRRLACHTRSFSLGLAAKSSDP
jgi:hypothetical protein